jgi:hypothetical protein
VAATARGALLTAVVAVVTAWPAEQDQLLLVAQVVVVVVVV